MAADYTAHVRAGELTYILCILTCSTNATSLMFAPGFVEAYVLREPGSQHKFVEKMFSRPSPYETAV